MYMYVYIMSDGEYAKQMLVAQAEEVVQVECMHAYMHARM
jgi:hypothetical protein